MSKKQATVVRKFNDAGTGKSFAKDAVVELDPGEFANFEAAGLVRAPTAEERKAASAAAGEAKKN